VSSQDRAIWRRFVLLGALCLPLGAWAAPVRAVRVDPTIAHRDPARSTITPYAFEGAVKEIVFDVKWLTLH
jgi:hypothetical protein